ncbi:hypothetical protein [Clostridium sp. YIM B02569]|uniref:hypothetical protein n=1 Tax=Clostridium sp. YIM B02569 TaxID=2911967 RepID=UPI001EECD6CC|nr:hypothetical protein [Clostridium sp. YIM B02569]
MDERGELIQQLKAELQWVKYRIRMLEIIEEKLFRMRRMVETPKELNLSAEEINSLNIEIRNLEEKVKALDSESRKTKDDEIL